MKSLLSTHHIDRTAGQLASLVALIAVLYIAGGIGMAYVAGFGAVHRRLTDARWWWLAPSFGAVLVAFGGYFFAYRGVKWAEDGPEIDNGSLLAVVTAAFGGFLAHGGTKLDEVAMRAGGADEQEAKVRVGALSGFEQAVLTVIVCPAAIAALALGATYPRFDFTWPWAIIPPPVFVLVLWLAERYRDRWRDETGWRGGLVAFFDTAHLILAVMTRPRRHGIAVLGMGLYWGADMFALWAATAAFGAQMTALSTILAMGTSSLFTRRTAPLAGGGVMLVALVPTLWYVAGVPFAAATLGVAAYRLFTLWLPLPWSLIALPKLRELSRVTAARGPAAPSVETAVG